MKSGSGKPRRNRKPRRHRKRQLGRRDRSVLAHLAAFSISWPELLQAVCCPERGPDSVKSAVSRSRNRRPPLIRSSPPYGKRVYYQLTFAGTRAVATSYRAAETLGRTTVIRQFALQSFLFLGQQQQPTSLREQRRLLDKRQLGSIFELKGKRLPRAKFYLASTGADDKRLGCVVVDYGSEPRRCATRIVQRVLRLLEHPKLRAMAKAGVFELSVLTLSTTKRKSLYERLNVSKRSGGCMLITSQAQRVRVRLFIHVVPGLLELIPDGRE